jgi:hypothetical protein
MCSEGKGLGSEESNGHIEPIALEMPDGMLYVEMLTDSQGEKVLVTIWRRNGN